MDLEFFLTGVLIVFRAFSSYQNSPHIQNASPTQPSNAIIITYIPYPISKQTHNPLSPSEFPSVFLSPLQPPSLHLFTSAPHPHTAPSSSKPSASDSSDTPCHPYKPASRPSHPGPGVPFARLPPLHRRGISARSRCRGACFRWSRWWRRWVCG